MRQSVLVAVAVFGIVGLGALVGLAPVSGASRPAAGAGGAAASVQPSRPARLCRPPSELRSQVPATGLDGGSRSLSGLIRGVVGGLLAAPGAALSLASIDAGPSFDREQYGVVDEVGLVAVGTQPVSTFSIDVDTASYSNVRRLLAEGRLPPPDAVRIEEMLNYFDYDYPAPASGDPFGFVVELGEAPWASGRELVHIGLRSTPVDTADLPPSNLVFLLDVSGSMDTPGKLPLLKRAFGLLVGELRSEDSVSVVVYAGAAGVVLEGVSGDRPEEILAALDALEAGGSTAGGAGICSAYDLARRHFVEGGNNRVILATDGDFNVGVSSDGDLVDLIKWERNSGVYLTVLGFGTGNLQDERMQRLAQYGNGNYAYIDTVTEARRALVDGIGATLLTVADDVKLQVEFNPVHVKGYRLIGYENRRLRREEFDDDTRDAGDLGAGHSVTALYEIVPAGSAEDVPAAAPLRYQRVVPEAHSDSDELLTVRVRYKRPGEVTSRLLETRLERPSGSLPPPSDAFRLASAVAEFGLVLRDSPYRGNASFDRVLDRLRALAPEPRGRRGELLSLVSTASDLRVPGR